MTESAPDPQQSGDSDQPHQSQKPPQPDQPATSSPEDAGEPALSKDACNIAMLAHLLGIFTGFLGPLIIWLLKKDEDPFIGEQSREALNFQITMTIAWIVSWLAIWIVIGCVLAPIVFVVDLVFSIIAAVKASNGEHYHYPIALRLVK